MIAPQWRLAVPAILLYPLAFLPLGFGINALYFSGCGSTRANLRYFDFSSAAVCARDVSQVVDHLSMLGRPGLAAACFVLGWCLSLCGVFAVLRFLFASAELPAAYTSMHSTR